MKVDYGTTFGDAPSTGMTFGDPRERFVPQLHRLDGVKPYAISMCLFPAPHLDFQNTSSLVAADGSIRVSGAAEACAVEWRRREGDVVRQYAVGRPSAADEVETLRVPLEHYDLFVRPSEVFDATQAAELVEFYGAHEAVLPPWVHLRLLYEFPSVFDGEVVSGPPVEIQYPAVPDLVAGLSDMERAVDGSDSESTWVDFECVSAGARDDVVASGDPRRELQGRLRAFNGRARSTMRFRLLDAPAATFRDGEPADGYRFIQAAGDASAMTIEMKRIEGDVARQYVLGRTGASDEVKSEEITWFNGEHSTLVRPSEVFESDEASAAMCHYAANGRTLPDDLEMRLLFESPGPAARGD